MLTLNDGRSELWQWDTGRTLAVDADCSQVHFSNKVLGRSIDVDVVDGAAVIPDILLQTDKDLNVWAFVGTAENGYTKISKTFKVNRRNKPADYVFTPVEQTTIAEIAEIAQSVRDDADAGLFDGKDGAPGKDGVSATHSWNGTVLTITSASGTSSSDLKGDKGDKGEQGEQGIPGTAGHTPEYGVDYGTPEQIDGIAQSAAEILQPEVNQIKDDLSDLAPAGANVGQLFRVAAISEDGKYTMEPVDMPVCGVTDVQIDGETVVVDNVANIPIVTGTSPGITPKIGGGLIIDNNTLAVSAPESYGMHVWGRNLGLTLTSYKQIDDRAPNQLLPIQTATIDYAVKAAMCDGKGAAWTAEEQAEARERIGASKKLGIWEDIATVNITEDAAAIIVNLDANGNTFSLSDIIFEITIPAENPVKQRSIYFGLNISTNFTFSRVVLTTNESYISGAITYARIVSGRVICDGAISGPSNTRYQPYYKYAIFNGHGGIEAESFDSVSVFTYSDAFPAGTTVILKGIRT